ncbi:MAG TPA: glutamate--tRNA ligase [Burkholderiales bacterium]|nr:glutamate--tRNA ligase [Burkholderiales bacterium]
MVRTRFAPSPTGYLHIGGARTALFSWAFARKTGGKFILRIEDTDTERSTAASTQAILDAMQWLGLDYDEGPFYQMQRLERYEDAAQKLVEQGKAYYCYASKEELDAMREEQRKQGLKPRYDGRWRLENAKGKTPPAGVTPVIRFRNPDDGEVTWDDLVKGPIAIDNQELDDLVILRGDGVPTYNFGVVVDDWDMNITHVTRGDDHVNNTPRQINIFNALGAPVPKFGHIPMILGPDGERLSKRHGAVSVMQYRDDGYLPEALVNYLARLGWGHGDAEVFTREQFVEWFSLEAVSRSPAKFNPEKLQWLNNQYMKMSDDTRLARLAESFLKADDFDISNGPKLEDVVALLKERANTVKEIADASVYFYRPVAPSSALRAQHYTVDVLPAMKLLRQKLASVDWNRQALSGAVKEIVTAHGLKMPKIAMPLRVMLTGTPHTPSIDAVLELIGRNQVLQRMDSEFAHYPG